MTAEIFPVVVPRSSWRYPCWDMACPCNIDKCLQCEEIMMALRRNPQRTCQEGVLQPFAAVKPQRLEFEFKATPFVGELRPPTQQRRAKRRATNARKRRPSILVQPVHRPANDEPFPFFQLPREIRDQVYSCLVIPTNDNTIAALPLLHERKRRVAAEMKREKLNRKRMSDGRPPVRVRLPDPEPLLHLNLLQASRALYVEAKDCLYSSNWFAITLDRLPFTTFETPFGWDLSRVTRLQLEVQLKDAAHMNSYVDWTALFSAFKSLRFLRVLPTFHPRYHDWALPELSEWSTAHYIHKAFFRELLAVIPSHVNITSPVELQGDMHLQGRPISPNLIQDMYINLGARRTSSSRVRAF
ncbi:hypothetical protein DE146DRAFT_467350 [Phaeosphaeria sp. MPI-PUGE-AT-0046c]|nr:hypothetical protein DE146DRAFT_467350 [Phaeosphaeria sp. MPI-PUGE-AT-0046c]